MNLDISIYFEGAPSRPRPTARAPRHRAQRTHVVVASSVVLSAGFHSGRLLSCPLTAGMA